MLLRIEIETHTQACAHTPPEEGHCRAGEIHSLAEDCLRVTEQKNHPKIFAIIMLILLMRKQRPR